ncbi:hypothetical protein [Gemmobacter sp.]|uniref:calcium-binding protein n=1 Tax=Gemmobacter sp. TaxID=1898957 RepID=UPI0025C4F626|nr:hypothetical protein [Gemmobacter sp.]
MPQMLNRLLTGTGIKADAQVINGAPLQWQWEHGADAPGLNARDVLPSGNYNTLILTEALPLASSLQWSDTYHYAREYAELAWAAQSGARVMIYETWAYFGPDEWNPNLPRYTDAQWRAQITADRSLWQGIADRLNSTKPADDASVVVVPGGTALGRLYDAISIGQGQGLTGIRQIFGDLVHLNDAGNYLIALVQHAAITGRSGVGLPTSLTNEWGARYTGWTEAQAVLFQHLAWEAVALESRIATTGSDPLVRLGTSAANSLSGGSGDDRLHGQAGADTLSGGSGRDMLTGDAGDDRLVGGGGGDWLSGGAGRDRLEGGAQSDALFGGTDGDRLTGGGGADRLSGETGADVFVFARGHGADTITDFRLADGDRLALASSLVGGLSAAALVSRFGTDLGSSVQLDFGNGDRIVLSKVASLSGLAAAIDVI